MTSRMTPVGAVVLLLAGLFAVGCTAQTSAVFEALLGPDAVPASLSEADASVDAALEGTDASMWWPHPEGYAMRLPAGWSGVAVSRSVSDRLLDAVQGEHPSVAQRIRDVLDVTNSRVTAVAADLGGDGRISPLMLILAQPKDGMGARGVKSRVEDQIAALPGRQGRVFRDDVRLPTGSGTYFEFSIADPDLGTFSVSSYLLRWGSQAYLVTFVASDDVFEDAKGDFEAIANSLLFGV